MNENAFDLKPDEPEFEKICRDLNRLVVDPQASPSFDGMSGAFNFSDEFPKAYLSAEGEPDSLLLPCISLLRYLWAYRQSLILCTPRSELKHLWFKTRESAPDWPGFLPERCSPEMRETALNCAAEAVRFSAALDDLDVRSSRRSSQESES
ncbi:hypothetical protein Enr10x_25030 [Gimesia panareensis]|uniref:Uncharacterized protein n=1 Tax=Gimesia panareensis TaxID=2527978 RepID=A0A518A5D8_9PLAN|nr:hypothetical protein Enr10x_25030 [Gimesia panareensis]QDU49963.1 hypothetical protein Pan110_23040 [Gimesia panareensis]